MKRVPKKVIAFRRNPYNGALQKWFGYGSWRLNGKYTVMFTFWFKNPPYSNCHFKHK